MKKPQVFGACMVIILGLIFVLHAQETASTDSIVQIMAEAAGLERVSSNEVPRNGTFWLVSPGPGSGITAPLPCPPQDTSLPIYWIAEGQFLVDGTGGNTAASALEAQAEAVANLINSIQETQLNRASARALGLDFPELGAGGADTNLYSSSFSIDPNRLWLEITNVSGGLAYLNLHNGSNSVYAIWVTTNLLTGWQVARELWPTNPTVQPFTLPTLNRQNLFVQAQDWTGVDSNSDGIPDWWIWNYYGDLSATATTLDSQGHTLWYDYTNNLVPGTFSFSAVAVTNNHVRSSSVPVQLAVTGRPYFVAVLVDDTNFAGAVWNNYTASNLTVNLGLTEGGYDVWIGLRGHADVPASAVWQGVRLELDHTAPLLVVTNPTVTTVSRPVLQLQGYASESLASLTYDLTNAAGWFTNQTVNLIGQYADTNTWTFTTNYFQAYDVALTNGANGITFYATDLAGNQTTLTTTLTLDYSGATNPPAIAVIWPPSNNAVAGTSFTLQGWLDDDTATILVSGLGTNPITGVVERGGRFTVPNLPLPAATNVLTIAATNAAGHGRTLVWTVQKSAVSVTMNALSTAERGQKFATVTGTISDASHDVYVNGVLATVSGDPAWEADEVPLLSYSGSATIDIEVYPPGSDPATTPPSGSLKMVVTLPPVVQAVSYVESVLFNEKIVTCSGAVGVGTIQHNQQWNSDAGGISYKSGTFFPNSVESWPDYWPEDQPWQNLS